MEAQIRENESSTADMNNLGKKMSQASDACEQVAGLEDKPMKTEIFLWYLYGLCSYFIHTVLLPIVFPLIISQIVSPPPPPLQGWNQSSVGLYCKQHEMQLFEALVHRSIPIGDLKVSPLIWSAISWAAGIFLSIPILAALTFHLDHGQNQSLIAGAASLTGAIFCLPVGFFKSVWLFAPYTAAIVAASTVASATHTRHLGLMVRGFTGPVVKRQHFPARRSIASRLSLHSTAAGTAGAAIIAAFTYHMLRHSDKLTSLWVVSIFSGLKWMVGISHIFACHRPGPAPADGVSATTKWARSLSIFRYPHAVGSAAGVMFSAFASSCIFTGGVLFVVGELCVKPLLLLFLWLAYFMFPLFSLPLLHPLQLLIRGDAMRMMLIGCLVSAVTSGTGFFFRHDNWGRASMILAAVLQGTGACVVHAYGRVLMLDCSPAGREGSFSMWFVWVKALGTCAGFAVGSAFPGDIGRTFGIAFVSVILGMVILIFGKISHFGGAVAAGHVRDEASEIGSPPPARDNCSDSRIPLAEPV